MEPEEGLTPPGGPGSAFSVRYLPEGEEVVLHARGWGRFALAAFLAFWLCGWAAGEVVVFGVLLWLIAGSTFRDLAPDLARHVPEVSGSVPWLVVAFLLVWFVFWTFGGLSTVWHLLRLLLGSDRFVFGPGSVTVRQAVGPFGRPRTFRRGEATAVRVRRRDGALVLLSGTKEHHLTGGGKREEKEWLAAKVRQALGLPEPAAAPAPAEPGGPAPEPPADWTAVPLPGGGVRLVASAASQRRTAGCAWTAALAAAGAAAWFVAGAGWPPPEDRRAAGLAFAGLIGAVVSLLVLLALWVSFARKEWEARPGVLVRVLRFGPWGRRREVRVQRFAVEWSKDSDGDEWCDLKALGPGAPLRVTRAMNDARSVVGFGRFLAHHASTGLDVAEEAAEEA